MATFRTPDPEFVVMTVNVHGDPASKNHFGFD